MLSVTHPSKYPSGADPDGILNILTLASWPEGVEAIETLLIKSVPFLAHPPTGQTFLSYHRDTDAPRQGGLPQRSSQGLPGYGGVVAQVTQVIKKVHTRWPVGHLSTLGWCRQHAPPPEFGWPHTWEALQRKILLQTSPSLQYLACG